MITPAIELSNVSKAYPVFDSPLKRLGELLTFQKVRLHRDYWALQDVSCRILRGETFCLVGENGSGKSTLLQIIAGILHPTSGTVTVHGRVAALLELGAGFNPEFTGRENVYLNAAVLGLSRAEIDRRYDQITRFADIGDFVDQPVRTYSSGMVVRLGFAVAIHCDPEILLIDEALAVGDIAFRQRCLEKVDELRKSGVTIILVSHSPQDIETIGDRAMWLQGGRVSEVGPAAAVMENYLAAIAARSGRDEGPQTGPAIPHVDTRTGDGRAEILQVMLLNSNGDPSAVLHPNENATIRIVVRANEPLRHPVAGFVMRNQIGFVFAETDTETLGSPLSPLASGEAIALDFELALPELYPAHFAFSVYVGDLAEESVRICDHIENTLMAPMIRRGQQIYGVLHLPCEISVRRDQRELRQKANLELV